MVYKVVAKVVANNPTKNKDAHKIIVGRGPRILLTAPDSIPANQNTQK